MSYTRDVKRILKDNGCSLHRHGRGDHEVWFSPVNCKRFTVDSDIRSRHTANGTLQDAGLPKAF